MRLPGFKRTRRAATGAWDSVRRRSVFRLSLEEARAARKKLADAGDSGMFRIVLAYDAVTPERLRVRYRNARRTACVQLALGGGMLGGFVYADSFLGVGVSLLAFAVVGLLYANNAYRLWATRIMLSGYAQPHARRESVTLQEFLKAARQAPSEALPLAAPGATA